MPAMKITVNRKQRLILDVALKNQKKLAMDGISMLRRLGKSDKPAVEANGEVNVLTDELSRITTDDDVAKKYEIVNQNVAKQLKAALVNFARQALARSEGAGQYVMDTTFTATHKAAQGVLDQLNEQLNFESEDLMDILEDQDATIAEAREKEKAKEQKEAKEAEDNAAMSEGTSPAPHRGKKGTIKENIDKELKKS